MSDYDDEPNDLYTMEGPQGNIDVSAHRYQRIYAKLPTWQNMQIIAIAQCVEETGSKNGTWVCVVPYESSAEEDVTRELTSTRGKKVMVSYQKFDLDSGRVQSAPLLGVYPFTLTQKDSFPKEEMIRKAPVNIFVGTDLEGEIREQDEEEEQSESGDMVSREYVDTVKAELEAALDQINAVEQAESTLRGENEAEAQVVVSVKAQVAKLEAAAEKSNTEYRALTETGEAQKKKIASQKVEVQEMATRSTLGWSGRPATSATHREHLSSQRR